MASENLLATPANARREERHDVLYRTRLTDAAGRTAPAMIVNVSEGGLMARSGADHAPGDRVQAQMPVIGTVAAQVRWALGGRIGCRLDRPLEPAEYASMLHEMLRSK